MDRTRFDALRSLEGACSDTSYQSTQRQWHHTDGWARARGSVSLPGIVNRDKISDLLRDLANRSH